MTIWRPSEHRTCGLSVQRHTWPEYHWKPTSFPSTPGTADAFHQALLHSHRGFPAPKMAGSPSLLRLVYVGLFPWKIPTRKWDENGGYPHVYGNLQLTRNQTSQMGSPSSLQGPRIEVGESNPQVQKWQALFFEDTPKGCRTAFTMFY